MTNQTEQQKRAAFESWAISVGFPIEKIQNSIDAAGGLLYLDNRTRAAWAWENSAHRVALLAADKPETSGEVRAEGAEPPAQAGALRTEPAIDGYHRFIDEEEENDPVERLRFFCSLAMDGKNWLDVEQFFDATLAERAKKDAALKVCVEALKALMKMDVKGHQLQDRLQFSTPSRALLGQLRSAITQVEEAL